MTAQMQTTTSGSVGYPGLGFRYCVVDFQFHSGVGGRDPRSVSGASFPPRR